MEAGVEGGVLLKKNLTWSLKHKSRNNLLKMTFSLLNSSGLGAQGLNFTTSESRKDQ